MPSKTYKTVKLFFQTPLHISKGTSEMAKGHHKIMSDSLKSAIVSTAPLLYDEWSDDDLRSFFDAFVLSSAFPFYQDQYLFPNPQAAVIKLRDTPDSKSSQKLLKKVEYVDQAGLDKILNGQAYEINRSQLFQNKTIAAQVPPPIHEEEEKDAFLFRTDTVLRVSVQRKYAPDEEESQLYYLERLFFAPDSGLYFFVHFFDDNFVDPFFAILKLLGDSGIGTDKNSGHGQFQLSEANKKNKFEELSLQLPDAPDFWVNYSLFCPKMEEFEQIDLKNSYYELIKRGGYISSEQFEKYLTYRKKSLYFFREGSRFSFPQAGSRLVTEEEEFIMGADHDLKPDLPEVVNPIWRDGRSIFLPMKKMEHETT